MIGNGDIKVDTGMNLNVRIYETFNSNSASMANMILVVRILFYFIFESLD